MTEDDQITVRIPLLQKRDHLVVHRADHGGYIVAVLRGGESHLETKVAISTGPELLDWLKQVFVRWQPVMEMTPAVPDPIRECNYPNCDGGPQTGYCHKGCGEAQKLAKVQLERGYP